MPGPDHQASAEPAELAALVRGIRVVEAALGDGRKVAAAAESNTAAVARKSLVALRDIAPGSILTLDSVGVRRPGTGLPPALRIVRRGPHRQNAHRRRHPVDPGHGGMRKVTAITVARSDYGILLPVLRVLKADRDIELRLIVAGMHLAPEFGSTWRAIEADGFTIDERVEMLVASDTPEGVAKSMGIGTMGFAASYSRHRPDILLTIGDRPEMHAAVIAALPFTIPVAHIHGGEVSLGAIDDALRHSMTKLSHLHFVATERCARRVRQMGEEAWRVTVSGAQGSTTCATWFCSRLPSWKHVFR